MGWRSLHDERPGDSARFTALRNSQGLRDSHHTQLSRGRRSVKGFLPSGTMGCRFSAVRTRSPLPTVSVIIPCRNERSYIGRCLDSVLRGDYPKERLEILVVDGMSDDGTREIAQEYSRRHRAIRLVANPRRIVPTALNLGIGQAMGAIIVRMDAHVEYPPDYISGLVGWLERTGADNVGGACVTRPANGTTTARAIAVALAHPFGVGNARFRLGTSEPRQVDTVPFGCFRRDVFERFGLFDEDLIRNQDDEFNFRVTKAGGRVLLVPGVVSHYYARGSLRQLARMYYQYGYFKPLVARKVGAIMTIRQLVPALFVASLLVAGVLAPWVGAARALFALVLGSYGVVDVAQSTMVGVAQGARVGAVLCLVFPVLHLSYGFGSLRGCWHFLVLRRRPTPVPLSR